MDEVSNKIIVLFVLIAITISLSGALIGVKNEVNTVTGFAQANNTEVQGNIVFTFGAYLSITLTGANADNLIVFGTLTIANASEINNAYCNSSFGNFPSYNQPTNSRAFNLKNFSDSPACFGMGDEMRLRNDGAYKANVTIVGDGTVDDIVCPLGDTACAENATITLYVKDGNGMNNRCDNDLSNWEVDSSNSTTFCDNLRPQKTVDIYAYLEIPPSATGGPDNDLSITLTAVQT